MDKIVATTSHYPERVHMNLDLEPGQANAVAALYHEYLEGRIRVCTPAVALEGESYRDAIAAVTADARTTYFLRQRLAEDERRDPVDALADAELQLALQTRRFAEEATDVEASWPPLCTVRRGMAAFARLLYGVRNFEPVAAQVIGVFLLATYDADRYRFDLSQLDSMLASTREDCMRVLQMPRGERQAHALDALNGLGGPSVVARCYDVIDWRQLAEQARRGG